jgi:hypothetical protein
MVKSAQERKAQRAKCRADNPSAILFKILEERQEFWRGWYHFIKEPPWLSSCASGHKQLYHFWDTWLPKISAIICRQFPFYLDTWKASSERDFCAGAKTLWIEF